MESRYRFFLFYCLFFFLNIGTACIVVEGSDSDVKISTACIVGSLPSSPPLSFFLFFHIFWSLTVTTCILTIIAVYFPFIGRGIFLLLLLSLLDALLLDISFICVYCQQKLLKYIQYYMVKNILDCILSFGYIMNGSLSHALINFITIYIYIVLFDSFHKKFPFSIDAFELFVKNFFPIYSILF